MGSDSLDRDVAFTAAHQYGMTPEQHLRMLPATQSKLVDILRRIASAAGIPSDHIVDPGIKREESYHRKRETRMLELVSQAQAVSTTITPEEARRLRERGEYVVPSDIQPEHFIGDGARAMITVDSPAQLDDIIQAVNGVVSMGSLESVETLVAEPLPTAYEQQGFIGRRKTGYCNNSLSLAFMIGDSDASGPADIAPSHIVGEVQIMSDHYHLAKQVEDRLYAIRRKLDHSGTHNHAGPALRDERYRDQVAEISLASRTIYALAMFADAACDPAWRECYDRAFATGAFATETPNPMHIDWDKHTITYPDGVSISLGIANAHLYAPLPITVTEEDQERVVNIIPYLCINATPPARQFVLPASGKNIEGAEIERNDLNDWLADKENYLELIHSPYSPWQQLIVNAEREKEPEKEGGQGQPRSPHVQGLLSLPPRRTRNADNTSALGSTPVTSGETQTSDYEQQMRVNFADKPANPQRFILGRQLAGKSGEGMSP